MIFFIFIFYFIYIYIDFIPKIFKIPLAFILYLNIMMYYNTLCKEYCLGIITFFLFLYLFILLKSKKINLIDIFKRLFLYFVLYVIIILSVKFLVKENLKEFSELISIVVLVLFSYIDFYNLKFNSIKKTLKTLTISFYEFIITTFLLFSFEMYLLLENIKNPSLYYLFLTIPLSLLMIYFFTKDLAPILKDLEEINKSQNITME